jgi:hypothetical protein
MMLGGDETGIDGDAPGLYGEVVVAPAEFCSAHLYDTQPAPLGSIVERDLFQTYDAVRDTVKLDIVRT